ncbi:MAG TPA: alkaline phosphatase family protein [Solirubrobacteraceae bacterium]|jgi:phospholipase C|nr:alkaline phosphatase family protein [Solirubrobacteraceae bacterium]
MAGREASSLPFPKKAPGTRDPDSPFDHIIVVMMENHSFDNLLGTHPGANGLSFQNGKATNSNPGAPHTPDPVTAFELPDTSQGKHVSQSWANSHKQINGGEMDGFVRSAGSIQPMGYYTKKTVPFAYSLAEAFTVGDKWFCSMPGPTYPNRRFLMAGTAYGATVTAPSTLLEPPPRHLTIFDSLSHFHINWCNYFSDLPMTAVIPWIIAGHSGHLAPITKFFHDCKAGTLPAVSFVDPRVGVLSSIGLPLGTLSDPIKAQVPGGMTFDATGPAETQEDPQDMYWGELWAYNVVQAVMASPVWDRTVLIYIYDEHGGYFDHVAPPQAIPPDDIDPKLQPGDPPGAYDMYGPRVPAIVVSPLAPIGGVTSVVHDHTSVLATIERKFNLPALTNRDANAETVLDFLTLGTPPAERPELVAPRKGTPSGPVTQTS